MEDFKNLVGRRSAHELQMRPRGFNYHRLRLVGQLRSGAGKKLGVTPAARAFPSPLEWLVSCGMGAAIAVAYLWWTGEFEMIWDWLGSR